MDEKDLERLRNISLFDIMGIKNAGRNKKIPCPFHADKTPSMVLYPDDNSFYCFGCGIHGQGAIDFLMAKGYGFSEVVKELDSLK